MTIINPGEISVPLDDFKNGKKSQEDSLCTHINYIRSGFCKRIVHLRSRLDHSSAEAMKSWDLCKELCDVESEDKARGTYRYT